jgi:hypothetical protein
MPRARVVTELHKALLPIPGSPEVTQGIASSRAHLRESDPQLLARADRPAPCDLIAAAPLNTSTP